MYTSCLPAKPFLRLNVIHQSCMQAVRAYRAAAAAVGAAVFAGKPAELVIAEVDAAAAHVSSALLPQLHTRLHTSELLQGAWLEADQ